MKLKPFFTYMGGKYRAAKYYPSPVLNTIVEPFAGSAGYSLNHAELDIRLYDLDPIISGLWDYLIKVAPKEILKLPVVVEHTDLLKICQEAKWLIGFWLNKGTSSPCKQPSAWMRSRTRPNSFWGQRLEIE